MFRFIVAGLCGLALAFGMAKFLSFNPQVHEIATVWHGWNISWVQCLGFGGFAVFYMMLAKVK